MLYFGREFILANLRYVTVLIALQTTRDVPRLGSFCLSYSIHFICLSSVEVPLESLRQVSQPWCFTKYLRDGLVIYQVDNTLGFWHSSFHVRSGLTFCHLKFGFHHGEFQTFLFIKVKKGKLLALQGWFSFPIRALSLSDVYATVNRF